MAVAVARFVAATPNSCDVERLISKYNLLKDDLRSSLKADTIKDYLYVDFNMPDLAEFDPRPAVKLWLTDLDRKPRTKAPSLAVGYFKGIFRVAKTATDKDWNIDV